jgi:hypothetical protein
LTAETQAGALTATPLSTSMRTGFEVGSVPDSDAGASGASLSNVVLDCGMEGILDEDELSCAVASGASLSNVVLDCGVEGIVDEDELSCGGSPDGASLLKVREVDKAKESGASLHWRMREFSITLLGVFKSSELVAVEELYSKPRVSDLEKITCI